MAQKQGVVISNCQCQPLKHALSLHCDGVTFDLLGVHLLQPGDREREVASFVKMAKEKYDVVISIPLSDDFGSISLSRIRSTFEGKFVGTISNIFFAGFHPDLTYVGGLSQRLESPLGDYHSKLALLGFLSGRTAAETAELYCHSVYERIGFYDQFAASIAELEHRDLGVEVGIAADLPALLTQELCFLSVNHPTSWLFDFYAAKIARWLTDKGVSKTRHWASGPMGLTNHLASAAIFPIYPEIAERHGLSKRGSYIFQTQTIGDTPATCYDLSGFLAASFEMYNDFGRDQLMASPQLTQLVSQSAALLDTEN